MTEFGMMKTRISEKLNISIFQLNGLLLEEGFQPPVAVFDVREDLADRVGAMIGRSADEVRDFYRKAVVA